MSEWTPEERADLLIAEAGANPQLLRYTLIRMIRDHHALLEENERLRERVRELERDQQASEPIALPPLRAGEGPG